MIILKIMELRKDLVSFPTPFLRALNRDNYSKGHSQLSVTGLLSPPQRTWLGTFSTKVESGYSSFAALLGTAVHSVLEHHVDLTNGERAEERFFHTILDTVVSGQIDFYENGTIFDYKVTGGTQEEAKPDHRTQAQMNGFLASINGVPVSQVAVVYLQRDWSYLQSTVNPAYPKSPFRVFLADYDAAGAEREFLTRIPEHLAAMAGSPRPCTPDEQWAKPDSFALMKPGAKRASKLCATLAEAEAEKKPGQIIQTRKGEKTFCKYFCGFHMHCPQFKRESAAEPNFEE